MQIGEVCEAQREPDTSVICEGHAGHPELASDLRCGLSDLDEPYCIEDLRVADRLPAAAEVFRPHRDVC
jgi:hypothetical protein